MDGLDAVAVMNVEVDVQHADGRAVVLSMGDCGPQPVELVGFRVGVSPAEKRTDRNGNEKIVGGTAWYQADEVRAISAVPSGRKSEG